MKVLILDGHPNCDRLTTVLLSRYAEALPEHVEHKRIAVRDLRFDPTFLGRPAGEPPLEPDLQRLWAAMADCDHLVLGFPLWWGAEPGPLRACSIACFSPIMRSAIATAAVSGTGCWRAAPPTCSSRWIRRL